MSIIFPWWCVAHISITLCDVDFSRGELNFFTFRGVANKFKKSHYVIAGCSYTTHMCAWACVCVSVDFFHRKKKRNEMKWKKEISFIISMPWRFQVNKVKWIGSLAIKVCAPFVFSLFFSLFTSLKYRWWCCIGVGVDVGQTQTPPVKVDLFSVPTRSISVFFRLNIRKRN